MRVHYTDSTGVTVEVDKRHLVASLVAFGAVGGKLSADKQTRIKQAASKWGAWRNLRVNLTAPTTSSQYAVPLILHTLNLCCC